MGGTHVCARENEKVSLGSSSTTPLFEEEGPGGIQTHVLKNLWLVQGRLGPKIWERAHDLLVAVPGSFVQLLAEDAPVDHFPDQIPDPWSVEPLAELSK